VLFPFEKKYTNTVRLVTADKKYDLDFKTPNNSGAEVKTGDEMIEMYKSFCKGGSTCFPYQLTFDDFLMIMVKIFT
jgi:hypothetical protein